MSAAEEELAKNDPTYDILLYGIVILQYVMLIKFLFSMTDPGLTLVDIAGRIWVMGLLCGVFGINVGHELGHRVNAFEQTLAKALLLTSLYMHFFTEHNKGHHKRVATPEDPSSARFGEMIYLFYFRTIIFSYLSAWHIANEELEKRKICFIIKQRDDPVSPDPGFTPGYHILEVWRTDPVVFSGGRGHWHPFIGDGQLY